MNRIKVDEQGDYLQHLGGKPTSSMRPADLSPEQVDVLFLVRRRGSMQDIAGLTAHAVAK